MNKIALNDLEDILIELNQSRLGRRLFLALVPQLLLACSSSKKSENDPLSLQDEILMSRKAFPEIRRDYPALQDTDVQNYLSDLGHQIVAKNGLADNPYQYSFTAVHVPTINAFALPAGKIFVTTPLIALTESEAELAGVLSHEIGHVTARHAALRIEAARKAKNESWMYGIGGAAVAGTVGYGVSSLICHGNSECVNRLVLTSALSGVQGGLLIQKYAFLGNSVQNELEADRIGFDLSFNSGYSVYYIGNFYSRIQKMEEDKNQKTEAKVALMDSLKTHPPTYERTSQLAQLIEKHSSQAGGKISSPEFDRIRRRTSDLILPA